MDSPRVVNLDRALERMHRVVVFGVGLVLLGVSLPETAQAFSSAEWAIGELCSHMEGNLGALLMSAAGVGAVISAALGNFRASYSLIIVGIGGFSVSAMLSLYFPDAATTCDNGSQAGTAAQQGGAQQGGAQQGGDPFQQN